MAEKLKMKVKNLELLLQLKSIILKATDVDNLLTQVCNTITELKVYDVSWAVLTNENDVASILYSSINKKMPVGEFLCWQESLKTSKLYTYERDSHRCKSCVLSDNVEATLLSQRLEVDGEVYGVFSVSIQNCLLDQDAKNQFVDFVGDISTAIYAIRLQEKNDQNQKELIESQKIYRKLLETSSLSVGIMDLNYEVTYMSNSLKRMFGFKEEDDSIFENKIKGVDFLFKDFQENAKLFMDEVLAKDTVNIGDVVFNTLDGRQLHVRLRISLMRNAHDEPNGFMVVFHDLTTEIKTKEELQFSEEKFRFLFMKAPYGVSLLSTNGVILDCNEKDAAILQMTRDEVIGRHIKTFMTPKYQEQFDSNFREFKSRGFKEVVIKLIRKDGSRVYVSRSVSALNGADGSLQSIIVHSRDVTEDFNAQQRIKLLYSAIEQSSSVFTVTDLEGDISYVNKRFSELTGYQYNEVIGQNPRFLKSGQLSDDVYKEMWDNLKEGKIWKGELCNKKKNGELYWEYAAMSTIRNDDGEITNLLKVAEDITQRKIADQELKEVTVRYHNIFNLVPIPIVIHVDGFIVDANRAAFLFSKGNDMKSLMGMDVLRFVHEDSKAAIRKRIESLMKGGGEVPVDDALFVNLEGEARNVRSVSKEVSFKGGRAFMVVFEDITDYKMAEQMMHESEHNFRDILNLHPDPVSIADLDTGVLYEANDAFLNYLKMKREDIVGVSTYDLKLYQNPKVREDLIKVINKEGYVSNYELDFPAEDGNISTLVSGIRFGDIDSNKVLFVARDISGIKRAEIELKELNVRYRNIFNMAPNPIIIHINGKIVDVNRTALIFAKVKNRKELIGTNILDFVHESSKKEILRQMHQMHQGGKIPPFDAVFVNTKREKRNVRTASNIIAFGGKQAFMVFFEDITERKMAERKLVESEARFRQFFNMIPDPVIITNIMDGSFLEFNKAAAKMTEFEYDKLVKMNALDYGLFKSIEQRDKLLNLLKQERGLLNQEVDLNINDNIYTMLVSASVIGPYEDQNVLWIGHDITNRKLMEQDLIVAKNKAEEGEKLKSSFLSNISHEIRTPMNAILGFSDLLRDSHVDSDSRNQYINIIQQRGTDLLKMISDIMDISKIESESLDIQKRAVRIRSVVEDAVSDSLIQLEKMSKKDVRIILECKIHESQLVNGDKYRIRQVLSNLLENAIKFTQQGTIKIRCRIEGDKALFEIEDTGCGIAADKIDSAFERFAQVHDIKDISIGGSGLGLSISKSLLGLMGGEIWIDSELEKGSKVTFTLEIYDGGDIVTSTQKSQIAFDFDWSGKTILIAEDEPSNQMFIKVILGKTKVNILMANDGQEAIDLFEANKDKIDLVLMDIKMPELNGYEVTQLIKQQNPNTIVIALTANAMNNDREEAFAKGCDDYLAKPIAKELLYSTIEKYI